MRRLLLLFFLTINLSLWAAPVQKPAKLPIVLKKDSTQVNIRKFDEQAIDNYSKQKEFIYDDVAPAKLGLWERFWRWFWNSLGKLFSGSISGSIFKYILIGLAIAIIVFVVIKLIGVDFKLFFGKSKAIALPYEESLENIHEIDFDDQLEQALKNKDYRLAVRLLYLKTLKHLTDRKLIDWQVEKTNQTYVQELTNESYQAEFSTLTNQFEYIWYGEFHIDQTSFGSIDKSFHQFNQKTT